jgi:hypothetical protein
MGFPHPHHPFIRRRRNHSPESCFHRCRFRCDLWVGRVKESLRLNECVIANSLIESFSNPLKGIFVGCGRITVSSDVTVSYLTGWRQSNRNAETGCSSARRVIYPVYTSGNFMSDILLPADRKRPHHWSVGSLSVSRIWAKSTV